MAVIVLTVDQRGSQTGPDLVPDVLETLNEPGTGRPLRGFERTAGDEVQGVLDNGPALIARVEALLRADAWNIGIGIGTVESPLPTSTRAGRGEAFVQARQAVTRAKQQPSRISVVGAPDYRAEQIETVLWLWAGVLTRRSVRGWEVADLFAAGLTHAEAAQHLGISKSAVSQRAQAAGVIEADRARQLLEAMVDQSLVTMKETRR
ncbi:transposase [Nocardioides marmoriginsengisoli]|uniref:Transposase n=1 Tax=Nocardioides marmoriginsengisoli TaxID=661483 RepID=A0A3N0CNZ9_9ACTN|nr:transposase [Nocardioides marmoriginsengisoli]RNL65080.1 transposase [Nocardioides marmoriginsengisoli]